MYDYAYTAINFNICSLCFGAFIFKPNEAVSMSKHLFGILLGISAKISTYAFRLIHGDLEY